MKKDLTGILLVAAFFVGLSVLLYPTLADFWNQKTQSQAIADYEAALSDRSEEEYDALFAAADAYNQRLAALDAPLLEGEQLPSYTACLNLNGDGIMGYLTIDCIDVELPIYHGTSDAVLNVAAGHLQGTALPVGGKGTHAAISAHRGLPSAKLFTDLDRLEKGDVFCIKVLNRTFSYEVDQIRIVLPHETDLLLPQPEEDYVTLFTCTPYGLNTHRLLVRGRRTEQAAPPVYMTTEAYRIDPLLAAPFAAIPMLLVLLIFLSVKYSRKNARRFQIKEELYETKDDPVDERTALPAASAAGSEGSLPSVTPCGLESERQHPHHSAGTK